MEKSKSNIKYINESIMEIKRMNYEKFLVLWTKVRLKIGSPFVQKDIFDLANFQERHK
jgi:hypothetical protein